MEMRNLAGLLVLTLGVGCDKAVPEPDKGGNPTAVTTPSNPAPAREPLVSAIASSVVAAPTPSAPSKPVSSLRPCAMNDVADAGKPAADAGAPPAIDPKSPLLNPALANEKAPAEFKVKFTTSTGDFTVLVTRAWAPLGADRFYNLVKIGYFNEARFFRVVPDFVVQWGIHADPKVSEKWRNANIQDDPVVESNKRGYLTYAKTNMPHTRSTQFFINLKDNASLDAMQFAPFAKVIDGMAVVDKITPKCGQRPDQGRIQAEGNAYLNKEFDGLDFIKEAKLLK